MQRAYRVDFVLEMGVYRALSGFFALKILVKCVCLRQESLVSYVRISNSASQKKLQRFVSLYIDGTAGSCRCVLPDQAEYGTPGLFLLEFSLGSTLVSIQLL